MADHSAIKERPILFSAPMVRAILEGRKTVTRRAMRIQPTEQWSPAEYGDIHKMRDGDFVLRHGEPVTIGWGPCSADGEEGYLCPYGQPGDRLWVRETWRTDSGLDMQKPSSFCAWPVKYLADNAARTCGALFGNTNGKTRGSIHMPRWASRITLEVTGVRVERLNEISAESAVAEGLRTFPHKGDFAYAWKDDDRHGHASATGSFRNLWESINGAGSWNINPWVWVVEFRRVTP